MHHTLLIFSIVWFVFGTVSWSMYCGYNRANKLNKNESIYEDLLTLCMYIVGGPLALLASYFCFDFTHWHYWPHPYGEEKRKLQVQSALENF